MWNSSQYAEISGNKVGQIISRAMSLVISRAIIDALKVNTFVGAISGYTT